MPTLAEHCKRPLKVLRDLSATPVPATVGRLNYFMQIKPTGMSVVPEHEALRFYMMNHAFACLQDRFDPEEPMPTEFNTIANSYFEESGESTARAFYYLLLICTRESRHVKNAEVVRPALNAKHGSGFMSFNDTIRGKDSLTAAEIFRKSPPDMPLGRFTNGLVDVFNTGHYNGGYGGKKWGVVAKVLTDFVWGKITPEMMMDTVWTLAHNNGPIFNKGMLYAGHTTHELLTILDVQRSGQIPQLVNDCELGAPWISKITTHHKNLRKYVATTLGGEFNAHVDWDVVEKLGSVKQYHDQKNKSKILFPAPVVEPPVVIPAKAPVEEHTQYYVINSKQKIKIIQRAK